MTRSIRPFLVALVAVLAVGTAAKATAQTRVGYVDLQRALVETEEGKAAKARLKREFDKRQGTLDAQQEELRRLKENLDKQAQVMEPEARRAKETELQRKVMELQQTYMTLQQELSKQEAELTDRIFKKMEAILAEIAKADNIDLVLEKSGGVLWAKQSLDLTDELIRKYNARHGKSAAK